MDYLEWDTNKSTKEKFKTNYSDINSTMKKTITILIIIFLLISWLIYLNEKEQKRLREIERIEKDLMEVEEINNLPEIPVKEGQDKG